MIAAANRSEPTLGLEESRFEALESDAHFDHVLFDAKQFGLHAAVRLRGGAGLPRAPRAARARPGGPPAARAPGPAGHGGAGAPRRAARVPPPVAQHRALAAQRKELNKLVAAYSSKTGAPHASIHLDLRRACGGPELASATCEQVPERIERIRRWFVGRR